MDFSEIMKEEMKQIKEFERICYYVSLHSPMSVETVRYRINDRPSCLSCIQAAFYLALHCKYPGRYSVKAKNDIFADVNFDIFTKEEMILVEQEIKNIFDYKKH